MRSAQYAHYACAYPVNNYKGKDMEQWKKKVKTIGLALITYITHVRNMRKTITRVVQKGLSLIGFLSFIPSIF